MQLCYIAVSLKWKKKYFSVTFSHSNLSGIFLWIYNQCLLECFILTLLLMKSTLCLIFQFLNKKEHKGSSNSCDSPEPDMEQYSISSRSDPKYQKINEEFELMMQRNSQMNGSARVSRTLIIASCSWICILIYVILIKF